MPLSAESAHVRRVLSGQEQCGNSWETYLNVAIPTKFAEDLKAINTCIEETCHPDDGHKLGFNAHEIT